MPTKIYSALLLLFMTFNFLHGFGQTTSADQKSTDKISQLKVLIESKKYQFDARSATSMRGKTVQLSSGYTIKINSDSLVVDLPYYGRSSTADYPATDVSVRFNSNQFTYKADSTKKGGWEITIQPKNESKANKIMLSVTSSGSCIVNISSSTRQPISYFGFITDYEFH
jgi:Domain of unknown function (DUF4251)